MICDIHNEMTIFADVVDYFKFCLLARPVRKSISGQQRVKTNFQQVTVLPADIMSMSKTKTKQNLSRYKYNSTMMTSIQ